MTKTEPIKHADCQLQKARDAVAAVDIESLPDEIAAEIRAAEIAVLSAKGAVEIQRQS